MARLPLVDPATATAPVSDHLAEVRRRLGATPNMTHSYLAEHVAHLDGDEIAAARKATASDPKAAAALAFASAVNDGRGGVTDDDVSAARAAGLADDEIAEVIGHVALNVLTNHFDKAVDVDFPVVSV